VDCRVPSRGLCLPGRRHGRFGPARPGQQARRVREHCCRGGSCGVACAEGPCRAWHEPRPGRGGCAAQPKVAGGWFWVR
jgi:hypothetical protein